MTLIMNTIIISQTSLTESLILLTETELFLKVKNINGGLLT